MYGFTYKEDATVLLTFAFYEVSSVATAEKTRALINHLFEKTSKLANFAMNVLTRLHILKKYIP